MQAGSHLRKEVSIDEALQKSIGEFGWGQKKLFLLVSCCSLRALGIGRLKSPSSQQGVSLQVSMPLVPAALQTFLLPFILQDPVNQHLLECLSSAGKACQEILEQEQPNICNLPREAWHWTHRCL